ncbi:hypothetical protein HanIR_Chr09g0437771 [Helianthus annuus]|nr:hypothetical protein HanIR_Chr09g0437771 [Helianthus annuus]
MHGSLPGGGTFAVRGNALGGFLPTWQKMLQFPLLQGALNLQSETDAAVGGVARVLVVLTVECEVLIFLGLHWLGRSQELWVGKEDLTWRHGDLGPVAVPRFFLGRPIVSGGVVVLWVERVGLREVWFGNIAISNVPVAFIVTLGPLLGCFGLGFCLCHMRFE